MTTRQPSGIKNLDQYGNPPLAWNHARELLEAQPQLGIDFPTFLGTVDPDGRPHAAGIGACWYDGDMYFVSGPGTRKSRNIAGNRACTITANLKGLDLVFEGDASQVTDTQTLEVLAALYGASGWPAEVVGTQFTAPFTAPSGGPPPWNLYRLDARAVYGVATEEPGGATRWRFIE